MSSKYGRSSLLRRRVVGLVCFPILSVKKCLHRHWARGSTFVNNSTERVKEWNCCAWADSQTKKQNCRQGPIPQKSFPKILVAQKLHHHTQNVSTDVLCCSMCLTTSRVRSLGVWLTLAGSPGTAMLSMDLSVMVLLPCCLRVPLPTPTLVCCDTVLPYLSNPGML